MSATAVPVNALPSMNPATGEILGYFDKTSPSLLPQVVSHARAVQRSWARLPVGRRCKQLGALRHGFLASRTTLADAIVAESGKPRAEALFAEIFIAADTAQYFADHGEHFLHPEPVRHHSLVAKAKSGSLTYEPFGVIGIISSWNYPLAIPVSQIIPALAAGNAVVCKTSEFTPLCGSLIERVFADAGFPAQLVTVVQGGAEVGQALIDAAPDKIIFTGSVATGRHVAQACARQLIPSVLELGGKDAMIVLSDADLDVASSAAVWGSYTNGGQVCLSVERLFVERSVREAFAARCVEKTKKLRLGPGVDPCTDVGPLIRQEHVHRMVELIDDAVAHGATVLCGGRPRLDLGANFFEPTVIVDVDSTMRLLQEETFGPILAIQSVRTAEEAVAKANDSPFALAASVWTADASRGTTIAKQLRVGAVMVNDVISYFAIAEAPHGGCGASGWGRIHGKAGLLEMVQPKYIDVDRFPHRQKPWWYRYGMDLERAADEFLQFEFGGTLSGKLRHVRGALNTIFRDHGLR